MSDDVARAVGAGGTTLVIAGKECQIRPLTAKELAEVERECIDNYRQSYLESLAKSAHLVFPDKRERQSYLREEMEKAAKWDVEDLPRKPVHDPKKIKVNKRLHLWLTENMNLSDKDVDGKLLTKAKLEERIKRAAGTALDSGILDKSTYENLVGEIPKASYVDYVSWWSTATVDGMVTLIWKSVQNSGVTKEQVMTELSEKPDLLATHSRDVEHLSAPAEGNG